MNLLSMALLLYLGNAGKVPYSIRGYYFDPGIVSKNGNRERRNRIGFPGRVPQGLTTIRIKVCIWATLDTKVTIPYLVNYQLGMT